MDFDIALFYRDDVDDQPIIDLAEDLRSTGANVVVEERENTAYASLDWAIPAAIIAYLAKPYIETILQEAAKDHYPRIRDALSAFAAKHVKQKQHKVISSTSPLKGKMTTKVSNTFAVWSTTVDGRPIKFLFHEDEEQEPSYFADSVGKIFDKLSEHIQKFPIDTISSQANKAPRRAREIYMLFDETAQDWIAVDVITEQPLGE